MTDALAIDPPAAEATLETIERVYRERGPAFLRVATAITGEGRPRTTPFRTGSRSPSGIAAATAVTARSRPGSGGSS